jgi:hypothetical protein
MKPGAALAALRKRYQINCAVCGVSAEKRDARAVYCSNACAQKARRQRRSQAGHHSTGSSPSPQ